MARSLFSRSRPDEEKDLIQSADRVVVEFTEGTEIPAEVIASVISADVALIKLDIIYAEGSLLPAAVAAMES